MYLFTLEPYTGPSSRHRCPYCKKEKQFTRYVHAETNEYLHEAVGKCNRQDKCNYHYTPRQYFADNPSTSIRCHETTMKSHGKLNGSQLQPQNQSTNQCSCLPYSLLEKSCAGYDENNFAIGLINLFGDSVADRLLQQLYIGTTKNPENGTIFWQVDEKLCVRTGKIMVYNPVTLKRIKPAQPAKYSAPVDWVHSRLQREKKLQAFNLKQCLFGLHQLAHHNQPLKPKPIGIVESEKTAIIASIYMP